MSGSEPPNSTASQHEARTHNHTFLIMAMLIFEIAQEELFEAHSQTTRDVA